MRFVCESCRAQYMINDEKVGPKGVKVRCRKCGYVIHVKRTDGTASAKHPAPVALSNDPEDALATQVMNSPLSNGAGADATLDTSTPGSAALPEPPTSRVNMNDPAVQAAMEQQAAKTAAAKTAQNGAHAPEPKPGDSFLGADEDEIGAVFDSVLAGSATGPTSLPAGALDVALGDGDRQSTRVLDADMVKRLAEESNATSGPTAAPKEEEVPQADWYVALNDKQTGPLSLEQIKDHWDKGEVGPDSLCWRAGFSDWIPVSDVKALASVLAPKPAKPIVVAPAATINPGMLAPAVVSVPIQSAFSAGGVVTTVQSEVQVPIAAAGVPSAAMGAVEDTGSWKPSAASALASLVKEEMDVLARPAVKKPEPVADGGGGLLDLPVEEKPSLGPNQTVENPLPPRAAVPAPAPVNPYMANPGATFSAPAVTQYRPPSNRGLLIGLGVGGGVLLLCLLGLVLFLALREPKVVVAPPPVAVAPVVPQPVAVAAPAPTAPAAAPPAPVADVKADAPKADAPKVDAPKAELKEAVAKAPRVGSTAKRVEREAPAPEEKKAPPAASASSSGSSEDDFEAAFGGGGSKKKVVAKEEREPVEEKKKAAVYVPPPPGSAGGGEVKDSLGQSDVFEVVSSNKGALARCAEEQKKREPGTSGRLVMKWVIQTSGKVSNVSVVSEEFKGTYMAGCVGGVIKAMSFPRHKKQGEPVQFPFKF